MREFVIKGGRVITPLEEVEADVWVRGGRIEAVGAGITAAGAEVVDASGCLVVPGHIDLHVQGHEGRDFWEGTYEAANAVSAALVKHGVTGATPTTDGAEGTIGALAAATERGVDGAAFLGIHSEGPFISSGRPGAIEAERIRAVDMEFLKRLLDVGGGHVRIMTVAPEVEGALEVISFLAGRGVAASLGHSTASFEEAERGFDAGAVRVTHLFNAMTGFADRADGGLVAAALLRENVLVEMVCDCVHIHPVMLQLIGRMKGAAKTAAITDSVKAAGMGAGRFESGGHGNVLFVEEAGQPPRLSDGTIAGSALSMDQAVRNLVRKAGFSLVEAFTMASYAPAATLGLLGRKGELAAGRDGDIVIYSGDLEVRKTFVGGEVKFGK